ncbi:sulfotransferase [uncultured Microbulbifer sp.]|uniref:sulfotransferase family protein n=1 Tax=uncultured Microbulbifer sp. TaxID=348147 RepID=UPI00262AF2F2|nr:sulfotransferase [uncultured Microbulbifer sp.]
MNISADVAVDAERKKPDFIIIGAMKCATTTLYDQLNQQSGIFMPALKEPNFFSDDEQYSRGVQWYEEIFSGARAGDLVGEASTHYTKFPTYPETIQRIRKLLPGVRLIYVMRHPIDRLVSQYIHEWSCGNIRVGLDEALKRHPELIAYSRYSYQLQPYLEAFGADNVLPVFFERLKSEPQKELDRVAKFIGYPESVCWHNEIAPKNISKERIRRFPFYEFILQNKFMSNLRRTLVPKVVRNLVKKTLQMNERPRLSDDSLIRLTEIFDRELMSIGSALGVDLNVENYVEMVTSRQLEWSCQSYSPELKRTNKAVLM